MSASRSASYRAALSSLWVFPQSSKSVQTSPSPLPPLGRRLGLELALPGEVDGLARDARHLLRRAEAHRVLGRDETQSPLRGRRLGSTREQLMVAVLDREHSARELPTGTTHR